MSSEAEVNAADADASVCTFGWLCSIGEREDSGKVMWVFGKLRKEASIVHAIVVGDFQLLPYTSACTNPACF